MVRLIVDHSGQPHNIIMCMYVLVYVFIPLVDTLYMYICIICICMCSMCGNAVRDWR